MKYEALGVNWEVKVLKLRGVLDNRSRVWTGVGVRREDRYT